MLLFFESDGETPLGRIALGEIRPGETYTGLHGGVAYQVVLRNGGALNMRDVAVQLVQVGSFAAYNYVTFATGATQPSPGPSWVDPTESDLIIGELDVDEDVNIWIDISVPIEGVAGDGQMVRMRAYGIRISGE